MLLWTFPNFPVPNMGPCKRRQTAQAGQIFLSCDGGSPIEGGRGLRGGCFAAAGPRCVRCLAAGGGSRTRQAHLETKKLLSRKESVLQPLVLKLSQRWRKACSAMHKLAVGGCAQGTNILVQEVCGKQRSQTAGTALPGVQLRPTCKVRLRRSLRQAAHLVSGLGGGTRGSRSSDLFIRLAVVKSWQSRGLGRQPRRPACR